MAADIQGITQGKPLESLSERALLLESVQTNREILRVLTSLDGTLAHFLAAFSQGGARGVRQAAREHANGR